MSQQPSCEQRPRRSGVLERLRPLLLAMPVVLLAACEGPNTFILHNPVQPNNAQTVTYTATAVDSNGVSTIEIWEDRNTLSLCSNGMQCATRVSTSRLTTCNFDPPQTNAVCTFTTASGYPDGSFIGYRTVATDMQGNQSSEGWIYFAAGAYPWPDNPIPVYATGAPAESLDLIFIPDPDYNGNDNQFMQDASALLRDSYLSNQNFAQDIRVWRGIWNFYITYQTGDAMGYGNGCNQAPANWTNLSTIVNSGGILHVNSLRDCGGVGNGSLFSVQIGNTFTNPTAIHESGHSVFSMADEYCCDGGYWEIGPEANVFQSQTNCENNATAHGWPTTDCAQIGTTGWWRSDGADDLMQNNNSNTNRYGRSDQGRVYWMYFQNCADAAVGC